MNFTKNHQIHEHSLIYMFDKILSNLPFRYCGKMFTTPESKITKVFEMFDSGCAVSSELFNH